MKISNFILISVVVLFNTCSYSQPDSTEIYKKIKKHYSNISLADGSPTYNVGDIKIEEIKKSANDTFEVKATVKGTYQNFSLPQDDQREHDFENKQTFLFYKNSSKYWECILKYD